MYSHYKILRFSTNAPLYCQLYNGLEGDFPICLLLKGFHENRLFCECVGKLAGYGASCQSNAPDSSCPLQHGVVYAYT